jgi:anti-sigma regulatory factor (Ser/Thr protein kinase)
VDAEAKSIQMQIEADPRLAAAAGGAARYFADAAGLEAPAIADWQTAIVAACNEAFEHLTREHPRLDVTLTRLTDRIEVTLSREGDLAPAVGLDTLAGLAPQSGTAPGKGHGHSLVMGGVDRVQYETHSGVAVTRLTKYITPAARRC